MTGPCPKCGAETGWTGPVWHRWFAPRDGMADYYKEVLRYACATCGYERDEPTKDAPTPAPPPPAWVFVETQPVPRPWWKFWANE